MDFEKEITLLSTLATSLRKTRDLGEKQELLLTYPKVANYLSQGILKQFLAHAQDLSSKIALFSIVAIEQHEVIFGHADCVPKEKIRPLIATLVAIDRFYESIGGIVGYQESVLKLMSKSHVSPLSKGVVFSRAEGIDLSRSSEQVNQATWEGIRALEGLGEIYPIGGLGSRLNLLSKTAEPLPAASLPFSGRTLLEGLVRDVQAREFLYYRLFNRQVTVPIALMTSLEKENDMRVKAICEKKGWFGRPQESFSLFSQISVPVVTQNGKWSMKAPLEMNLQPGGHGALWKAAEERGIFFWFQSQEKNHLVIRQINNPIAGLDFSLLALIGIGKKEKKTFGFCSCERLPHAAEGVLVLVESEGGIKRLSNIEYTDLKHHGLDESPAYPANTNILYVDLQQILPVIKKNPLPGLMLNMKNKEPFLSPLGEREEVMGGRLESMMQNISDSLLADSSQPLPTFLTYNARKRTISAAKKSFEKGKKLLETPEGAFYDLLYNAHDLLKNRCGFTIPPFCSEEEYLQKGPSTLFLYHPALGPLYDLIAQKVRGGIFALDSELQLEIADLFMENFELEGSARIVAQNILGHDSQGIIRYSQRTGKCFLKNIRVKNRGINRKITTNYWKNQIKRHQALTIVLKGHSEFYAENITFEGQHTLIIPHGERWLATQRSDGTITYKVEKPGWEWKYQEDKGSIKFLPLN